MSTRETRTPMAPTVSPWLGLPFFLVGLLADVATVAITQAPAGALPPVAPVATGLFGFVFTVAGATILFGGLAWRRQRARRARLLAEEPRRPWRAEERWHRLETRSASGMSLLRRWILAVYVVAFVSLFVVIALSSTTPTFIRVVVGLFSLVGVWAIGSAIYHTLQHWKWGRARLTFRRVPVAPGERLEGMIFCGRRVEPEGGFKLTLLCSEDRVDRTRSGGRSTVTYKRQDLFEAEHVVGRDLLRAFDVEGTAIPVDLPIPAEHPGTAEVTDRSVYWELDVRAATSGIDFHVTFALPVFVYADESLVERRV